MLRGTYVRIVAIGYFVSAYSYGRQAWGYECIHVCNYMLTVINLYCNQSTVLGTFIFNNVANQAYCTCVYKLNNNTRTL